MLIESNNQVPLVHKLRLFREHLRDNAGSLRGHGDEIARDVRIVGAYIKPVV